MSRHSNRILQTLLGIGMGLAASVLVGRALADPPDDGGLDPPSANCAACVGVLVVEGCTTFVSEYAMFFGCYSNTDCTQNNNCDTVCKCKRVNGQWQCK